MKRLQREREKEFVWKPHTNLAGQGKMEIEYDEATV